MRTATPLRTPSRLSVRRFRADLARTIRRVATEGDYLLLTRRGAPVAAVVAPGALELLAAGGAVSPGRSPTVTRVPVRHGFRPNLAGVLRRIAADGEYVVLTRRGVPVAAVVPVGLLDLLDAAAGDLATRFLAATGDLHDLEAAAPDVTPRTDSTTAPPRRSRRPPVPRRE